MNRAFRVWSDRWAGRFVAEQHYGAMQPEEGGRELRGDLRLEQAAQLGALGLAAHQEQNLPALQDIPQSEGEPEGGWPTRLAQHGMLF